ncbi:MAG: TetR/AcrR family transcriptional regulator [Oscillospiraceae bacterium]|nr:TetR/AcrR family transcriptional regulator [Oscillospiraceae bacterium]
MSNKKEKMMEAYIQLLDENPTKRVTVNSIVARCGVSRNTFYYYFPDIPSLIEEIEAKWVSLVGLPGEAGTIVDCLRPLAKYAETHRSGLLHAYHSTKTVQFRASMDRLWNAVVNRYIEINGTTARNEEEKAVLVRFYKAIFIGMTINWLDAEMSYDLLADGRRVCELLKGEEICKNLYADSEK